MSFAQPRRGSQPLEEGAPPAPPPARFRPAPSGRLSNPQVSIDDSSTSTSPPPTTAPSTTGGPSAPSTTVSHPARKTPWAPFNSAKLDELWGEDSTSLSPSCRWRSGSASGGAVPEAVENLPVGGRDTEAEYHDGKKISLSPPLTGSSIQYESDESPTTTHDHRVRSDHDAITCSKENGSSSRGSSKESTGSQGRQGRVRFTMDVFLVCSLVAGRSVLLSIFVVLIVRSWHDVPSSSVWIRLS